MGFSFKKQNRSAFENFLRTKYEMFTETVKVSTLPYYLCIEPSDKCQLRCPTCPTGIENESRMNKDRDPYIYRENRKKLSLELCESLFDELGDNLFLVMFYNYGEPLLNPRLHEFIRMATDRNIATELHTNLSLTLSDQRIEQLLSSGIGRISASVDGFSQAAYEVHRVGGNVKLVHENLKRLAKARDRLGLDTEILYNFLLFKHNEHEVEQARNFAQDIGIAFDPRDAFISDSSWLPSHRQHEQPYYSQEYMDTVMQRWEGVSGDDLLAHESEDESHSMWSPIPKHFESILPRTCGWHYGFSVVTAGGPVAPCCAASKEKEDMGTVAVGEVSFADVWNNEFYTKSRMAMVGKAVDGLDHIDPTCTRCYFPKFVHHLYDIYDALVVQRFGEVFGDSEPEMAKAFALLGNSYGSADTAGFVAHYEQYQSMNAFPQSVTLKRDLRQSAILQGALPQYKMSNEAATAILMKLGSLVSGLGLNGSKVFDESLLEHPKDEIVSAIVFILNEEKAADKKAFAKEAGAVLAFFQPGVGEAGVSIDSMRCDEFTWRNVVEAEMQKNNPAIASQTQVR